MLDLRDRAAFIEYFSDAKMGAALWEFRAEVIAASHASGQSICAVFRPLAQLTKPTKNKSRR